MSLYPEPKKSRGSGIAHISFTPFAWKTQLWMLSKINEFFSFRTFMPCAAEVLSAGLLRSSQGPLSRRANPTALENGSNLVARSVE